MIRLIAIYQCDVCGKQDKDTRWGKELGNNPFETPKNWTVEDGQLYCPNCNGAVNDPKSPQYSTPKYCREGGCDKRITNKQWLISGYCENHK